MTLLYHKCNILFLKFYYQYYSAIIFFTNRGGLQNQKLYDNLQIHNKDFAALTPYADQIRKIAKRRMSLKSRQKVLTKKAGFLPLLLKGLAGFVLPTLLRSVTKKLLK